MKEIYEYDLNNLDCEFKEISDLYEARLDVVNTVNEFNNVDTEVTIVITAFNRLEKVKKCVESVLKYTTDVNYNLILFDNGSDDGTFEYFKSIDYDKLRIIRLNRNYGHKIRQSLLKFEYISKYYVGLPDDVVVTKNWLSNLLKVVKSDPKIGMVNAVSSNVSNLQMVNLEYNDSEDMQIKAKEYNVSDSTKWQERLRLVTLGTLYSKDCLYALGWPVADCGFTHNFIDDDISFRVRRAGYKVVLAGDTWIHHDHDINTSYKTDKYAKSIEIGRKNFQDKYFGIDAWDDVNNYIFPIISKNVSRPINKNNVNILGIDVKCGTPILDIKNIIRKFGIFDSHTSAFTRNGKYQIDLETICDGQVVCDRTEYLSEYFEKESFDYIIIDKNINEYINSIKLVKDAFSILKKNGQMFLKLRNTYDIYTQLEILGYTVPQSTNAIHCTIEAFYSFLKKEEINADLIYCDKYSLNDEIIKFVNHIVHFAKHESSDANVLINKLMTKQYWFKIVK